MERKNWPSCPHVIEAAHTPHFLRGSWTYPRDFDSFKIQDDSYQFVHILKRGPYVVMKNSNTCCCLVISTVQPSRYCLPSWQSKAINHKACWWGAIVAPFETWKNVIVFIISDGTMHIGWKTHMEGYVSMPAINGANSEACVSSHCTMSSAMSKERAVHIVRCIAWNCTNHVCWICGISILLRCAHLP